MEKELIMKTLKNTKRIAIISLLIIVIVIISASVFVSVSVKNFTVEVKDAIKQEVEAGNNNIISLKEDAFSL
jgi:uncharacterized protein YpmB